MRQQCSNVQHNPVDEGKAEEKFVHILCFYLSRAQASSSHYSYAIVTFQPLPGHFMNEKSLIHNVWALKFPAGAGNR